MFLIKGSKAQQPHADVQTSSTFASQFLTKIIDNLQISIFNIHVMVESDEAYPNVCYLFKMFFLNFHFYYSLYSFIVILWSIIQLFDVIIDLIILLFRIHIQQELHLSTYTLNQQLRNGNLLLFINPINLFLRYYLKKIDYDYNITLYIINFKPILYY